MNPVLQFFRKRVWAALPDEVSPKDLRTAGIVWPLALLFFSGLVAWRRHRHGVAAGAAPYILLGLAPLLAAALFASPALGVRTYRAVMLFFLTIGFFVSHLLLICFFYLAVTPLAFLLQFIGKDLLDKRAWKHPSWIAHAPPPDRRRFFRQF